MEDAYTLKHVHVPTGRLCVGLVLMPKLKGPNVSKVKPDVTCFVGTTQGKWFNKWPNKNLTMEKV